MCYADNLHSSCRRATPIDRAAQAHACWPSTARCLPRRRCGQPRGGDAAEDSAPRSVRDHAGYTRSRAALDQASGTEVRRFPVPKSHALLAASWDATVRPNSGRLVEELGLDPADYGTHSMRRIKATLIYRRTRNLRAVQLLLGHTKLEPTVRSSASRLMTHSRSPSRRKSERDDCCRPPVGRGRPHPKGRVPLKTEPVEPATGSGHSMSTCLQQLRAQSRKSPIRR